MYTNVKQHCNSQSQNNFSTLNITLSQLYISFGLCVKFTFAVEGYN